MLEYKLKWLKLPVKYVDAKNTSKTCPLCSGHLVAYGSRLMTCGKCNLIMDRDIIAVLNLQMRGAGFPQRALNELIEREEISGDKNYASPLNSEPNSTPSLRISTYAGHLMCSGEKSSLVWFGYMVL